MWPTVGRIGLLLMQKLYFFMRSLLGSALPENITNIWLFLLFKGVVITKMFQRTVSIIQMGPACRPILTVSVYMPDFSICPADGSVLPRSPALLQSQAVILGSAANSRPPAGCTAVHQPQLDRNRFEQVVRRGTAALRFEVTWSQQPWQTTCKTWWKTLRDLYILFTNMQFLI